MATSLASIGRNAHVQWQLEKSEQLVRESIAIRRGIGDQAGLADGLVILGYMLTLLGRNIDAREALQESITISKNTGNLEAVAASYIWAGFVEKHLGDYSSAREQTRIGLMVAQEINNKMRILSALSSIR